MKARDIEIGKEYAVRTTGKVVRARMGKKQQRTIYAIFSCRGIEATYGVYYHQVLMPWPQWEQQQKAKKAQTEDIDQQRNETLIFQVACTLRERGIPLMACDYEFGSVTLHVNDLARLLG